LRSQLLAGGGASQAEMPADLAERRRKSIRHEVIVDEDAKVVGVGGQGAWGWSALDALTDKLFWSRLGRAFNIDHCGLIEGRGLRASITADSSRGEDWIPHGQRAILN
jgi:hypothetical protein